MRSWSWNREGLFKKDGNQMWTRWQLSKQPQHNCLDASAFVHPSNKLSTACSHESDFSCWTAGFGWGLYHFIHQFDTDLKKSERRRHQYETLPAQWKKVDNLYSPMAELWAPQTGHGILQILAKVKNILHGSFPLGFRVCGSAMQKQKVVNHLACHDKTRKKARRQLFYVACACVLGKKKKPSRHVLCHHVHLFLLA